MDETTPTGEPTEKQMAYALKYQVQAKLDRQKRMQETELREGDPISAIMKLMGVATSGMRVEVTDVISYGCVEAVGRGGYVCDYVQKTEFGGSIGMYDQMAKEFGDRQIRTARFKKVRGVWMVMEQME